MTTFKLNAPTAHWHNETSAQSNEGIYNKFMAFAASQNKYRTAWFLTSLVAQSVLFLPVPAILIYYYNAPIAILVVTMSLFFANVIAGMGGSGIKYMIALFALSVVVHLLMILAFIV